MRKILLALLFIYFSCYALFAQNKTLGVGVTTPNPNAALHVESPTGNQGFIMPRLTTVQRQTMTSLLTAADKGLTLYDTDLNTIYTWNGSSWQNTGQVSGGGYFESTDPLSTAVALYATTNSNADAPIPPVALLSESTGNTASAGSFRINNAENPNSALYAETLGTGISVMGVTSTGFSAVMGRANGGFSNGVSGVSSSPETGSYAILGENSGGGPAGVFGVSNATNTSNALEVSTIGTGGAAKITVNNIGSTMPALWAETNSNQPLSAPIYGRNTGIGDVAGSFRIENTGNASAAAYGETNGTGAAVFGNQLGLGRGGQFQIQNTANGEAAVRSFTNGTGMSGFFTINNPSNSSAGIFSTTNGTGPAINAENTGSGNGFAGSFNVTNPANNYPAIQASTTGGGSGVRVMQSAGLGTGIDVFMQNAGSGAPGIAVDQGGLGNAGSFIISNSTSGSPAVSVITNGAGAAVYAKNDHATNGNAGLFEITNTGNSYPALQVNTAGPGFAINARHTGTTGDAIYAERTDASFGSAGNFYVSNASNGGASMYASTVAPAGVGVGAANDANGIALQIFAGGLRATAIDISVSTITARAFAYRLVTGTNFTLDFNPVPGDVFMIYNETGQTVMINGITILNGEGKMLVVFPGGAIRGF